jgi:carotenoid cleavage dioxygenase-like enzyme
MLRQMTQKRETAASPSPSSTPRKDIFISDPEQNAYTGIQPLIRWSPLVSLPTIQRWRIQVFHNNERYIEADFDGRNEFPVPNYLTVGESYRIRVVANAEDGSTIVSRYRHIKVDPEKAFPDRIECGAAWGHTFIGKKSSEPLL